MTKPTPGGRDDQLVKDITPFVAEALANGRPVRVPLRRNPATWLLVAAALLLLFALVAGYVSNRHTADENKQLRSDVSALSSQVRGLGGTPVTATSGAAGKAGPTGAAGATGARGPAPTDAQVAAAVMLYCARHAGCTGTPSPGQVRAAVSAYCAAGACTGPRGAAGPSGTPGATGAQGAGPTDTQIASAVAAYCSAHGDCTGPAGPTGAKGEQGEPGTAGADGRGIASVDCTGLGVDQLVIHYDDGTDQTVACDLTPDPTPTGTETP